LDYIQLELCCRSALVHRVLVQFVCHENGRNDEFLLVSFNGVQRCVYSLE
jgi:hypothetical protein